MNIIERLLKCGKCLSQSDADFIMHSFGNVKTDEGVKQYLFYEGDEMSSVIDFLEIYYPEYAKNYKVYKGIV